MSWVDLRHPPLSASQRLAQRIVQLDRWLLDLVRTRQRVSITDEPPLADSAPGSIHADATHGALSIKGTNWVNVGVQRDEFDDPEEDSSTSSDTTTFYPHGEGFTFQVPAFGMIHVGIQFDFKAPINEELLEVGLLYAGVPIAVWQVAADTLGLWLTLGASHVQRRAIWLPSGPATLTLGARHTDVGSTIHTRNRTLYSTAI